MNLFAMQGKKKNPLAALMAQPQLMELLQQQEQPQGPTLEQLGANPQSPAVTGMKPPIQEPPPQAMPQQQAPQGGGFSQRPQMFPSMPYMPPTPRTQDTSKSMLNDAAEGLGTVGGKAFGPKGFLTKALGGSLDAEAQQPMVNAPPKADEFVGPPAPEQGDPQEPNFTTTDEQGQSLDLATGGGLFKGALDATSGILQKYGKMAQTAEGAKVALKHEFQDTPEMDEIIAKTEADLAFTRDNKKQPGVGEFIALALMNLANHDYKNNAYMILGTGEQQAKENQLENRLSDLVGSRAQAKMHGRQQLRGMESQQRYQNLQAALKQQEMMRKQSNEDRDFGLKKQGQDSGLLRSLAGQEANVIQSSLDKDAVKAASTSRAKLKKLLGLDDAGLDRMMQQQQQKPPPDERQSRMFGDLMGGGGYA